MTEFLSPVIRNESQPFILPYRNYLFMEINDSSTFWTVWTLQLPMIYIHTLHGILVAFLCCVVLHVCGKMAILSFRIKNISLDKCQESECSRSIFRDIVTKHQDIIQFSKDIEGIYDIILIGELLFSMPIVGLTLYLVILVCKIEDKAICISCFFYVLSVLWILYGYCAAGEYMLVESNKLYNAYYDCDWYNSTESFKKQILICMINSKKPTCLNGGGVYVFCLEGYTGILKTTAGYVSMLRNIT
ncbi:odorant receptor 43a-like [Venturia canescens]|uniref:odorant receptor 43a-like n=1 Tax=Venturia canescens TaxID=32260 RepID=UPI001C9D15B0|nr:odorant receptor 43a-like [Venturia canescens]